MFNNGLFEIAYPLPAQPQSGRETLLAVCREGKLTASDPYGGVYLGDITIANASCSRKAALTLSCDLPEGGELVTGQAGEPSNGQPLAIFGVVDPLAHRQVAVLVIDGEPLEVEIAYLGPLPA